MERPEGTTYSRPFTTARFSSLGFHFCCVSGSANRTSSDTNIVSPQIADHSECYPRFATLAASRDPFAGFGGHVSHVQNGSLLIVTSRHISLDLKTHNRRYYRISSRSCEPSP